MYRMPFNVSQTELLNERMNECFECLYVVYIFNGYFVFELFLAVNFVASRDISCTLVASCCYYCFCEHFASKLRRHTKCKVCCLSCLVAIYLIQGNFNYAYDVCASKVLAGIVRHLSLLNCRLQREIHI